MRILVSLVLGLAAVATPALALTVSSAPNRDALPHLKPTTSGSQGVDIRDSWLSSDRPQTGLSYGQRATTYPDAPRYSYDPFEGSRRLGEPARPLSPAGTALPPLQPRR